MLCSIVICVSIIPLTRTSSRFQKGDVKSSDGYPVHDLNTGLNYTTIQEAIDAPETLNGHTILVDAGTFNEGILLNKAISLFGENRTNTIIDGYGVQWAVQITACNVTISGFTIRNGGNGMPSWIEPNGGIKLVSNYSTISDNVIVSNDYSGIWSGYYYAISNGIIIEDNFVSGNFYGIALGDGSTSNNLTKNIVTGNTWVGIQVAGEDNILRQNIIDNNTYGFGAYGIQDIDESNLIDGRPIIYWINEHDRMVPNNAGYIAAIDCDNISVINVSLKNLLTGIEFRNTNRSTIRNAIVLNCSFNNVFLLNSHGNILTNCTLMSNTGRSSLILALRDSSNNTVSDTIIEGGNVIMSGKPYGTGIDVYNCSYNLITKNAIVNNWNAIFLTYSNSNTIYHNNFINNPDPVPIGAIKENNTWDNGIEGNYWSDYNGTDRNQDGIGDTPYVIDENNLDHYPLMGTFQSFNVSNLNMSYDEISIVSNSTVEQASFVLMGLEVPQPYFEIILAAKGQNGTTGFCRITFQNELLNSSMYPVNVAGNAVASRIIESNGTYTTLYFTFNQTSSYQIYILPEFPSFVVLPLFMIATLLAIIFYKRRHQT